MSLHASARHRRTRTCLSALAVMLAAIGIATGWAASGEWPRQKVEAAAGSSPASLAMPAGIFAEHAYLAAMHGRHHAVDRRSATLRRGEALADLLQRLGVEGDDAARAAHALNTVFDTRRLQAGLDVRLDIETTSNGAARLLAMALRPEAAREVYVQRSTDNAFRARELNIRLTPRIRRVSGNIEGSLYLSANAAGASNAVLADVVKLLAYSVDFQREIFTGDTFEILYTAYEDLSGNLVKTGELHFVALQTGDRTHAYWRFEQDDEVAYYDRDGEAAQRLLMRTPIDGARLSSNFGKRRHPILGYARMHKGVDFAAPRGTPIYAAGNGVVERANRFGSFGNYVRIRHNADYKTAYAHLHRFARGIRAGTRVRQGQVIGYVGTTGRSTGPHLHYEVHYKGEAVNPTTLPDLGGEKLQGEALQRFHVERALINALRRKTGEMSLAEANAGQPL